MRHAIRWGFINTLLAIVVRLAGFRAPDSIEEKQSSGIINLKN